MPDSKNTLPGVNEVIERYKPDAHTPLFQPGQIVRARVGFAWTDSIITAPDPAVATRFRAGIWDVTTGSVLLAVEGTRDHDLPRFLQWYAQVAGRDSGEKTYRQNWRLDLDFDAPRDLKVRWPNVDGGGGGGSVGDPNPKGISFVPSTAPLLAPLKLLQPQPMVLTEVNTLNINPLGSIQVRAQIVDVDGHTPSSAAVLQLASSISFTGGSTPSGLILNKADGLPINLMDQLTVPLNLVAQQPGKNFAIKFQVISDQYQLNRDALGTLIWQGDYTSQILTTAS